MLDVYEQNGMLSILACMLWWFELAGSDSQWTGLLQDNCWIMDCLQEVVGNAESHPPSKKQRT
ncbi:hypothetical protein GYMLUDRAFT_151068 [Collybiopsis luxurians FD-317 M1]|nr:hypothetical protein GYMLUDRAFT_151068 [Collybiopsis luxurians FD-317 M1]